ncbi:VOC family protein [Streptomyces sp. NPDC001478]
MTQTTSENAWPGKISALTLFTEDLDATKRFYREVFGLPVTYENDNSAVFDFGNTIVNLLRADAAHDLIAPARVADPKAGARVQLTLPVDDVDKMCEELVARG